MSEALKLEAPEPTESPLDEMVSLQQQYTALIIQASLSGSMDEVQRLLAELTNRTQGLVTSQHAPAGLTVLPDPPVPVEPPLYDNSICDLDLNLTVYDGDRDTLKALLADQHFVDVATQILADAEPFNARKNLLKSALKLTPRLAPKVYEILKRCRDSIGLRAELEIYVCPDVNFNAFCYPPHNGKYIIGVTSALLEKFDDDELAFVIGHEIGHALFMHSRFPVQYLLHHGGGELSPLHAMRLYSWKRNAELSSDRVGLLCGRNFDAAARAFFKLSSGVTDNSLSFQLREYVAQFSDLQSEMESSEVDPEDWYSTHPFSPMRLKALDMFHRSETYANLVGNNSGAAELSEDQLEFEIKKFMSLMEPSYLQESSELADHMKNFVFLGGWLVAAANDVVEEAEVDALASILIGENVKDRIATMMGAKKEDVMKSVAELAEKLNVMLPVVSKLNVLKDLAVIAGADGDIDDLEIAVLYEICSLMNIRTEFIDHVLDSSSEEDG